MGGANGLGGAAVAALLILLGTVSLIDGVAAGCPYANQRMVAEDASPVHGQQAGEGSEGLRATAAAALLDYEAVKVDIAAALTDSQAFWPADDGNFGRLMIRLAWHCAGKCRGGRVLLGLQRTKTTNQGDM